MIKRKGIEVGSGHTRTGVCTEGHLFPFSQAARAPYQLFTVSIAER